MTTTIAGKGVAERRHPDPNDELATAAGPCDDATAIVPPPPSEVAPDLAWAADDDDDNDESVSGGAPSVPAETLAVPWGLVWGIAAAVVIGCVLVAAVGALFFLGSQEKAREAQALGNPMVTGVPTTMPAAALPPISSEPLAPPTQAPAAAPPPPTVTVTVAPHAAPPPAAAPTRAAAPKWAPAPDQVFRQLVLQIPGMTVTNWGVAQTGGHNICTYLRQGHSRAEAVEQVAHNDPSFLPFESASMVDASVAAYCPDQQ